MAAVLKKNLSHWAQLSSIRMNNNVSHIVHRAAVM